MMLYKITLLSSLLFFILGANVFAQSYLEKKTTPLAQIEKNTTVIETTVNNTETVMKEHVTESNDTALDGPSVMNYILPVFIGLIIIFGFGSYWLIFRRKQV